MNRANVESILVKRCSAALEMVGMDYTTISGINADLNDLIWSALKRLGYAVANITVVDADITQVVPGDESALLDIAELRTLETAYNAAVSLVDVSVGPRRESLSQFGARLEKLLEAKRNQIKQDYGALFGIGLEAGSFSVSSLEDGTNVY